MVRGFVALGLPYEWGLTLRSGAALPADPGRAVRAGARGAGRRAAWICDSSGFVARLPAYGPVLIAVLIGALRHGERLGWALEARALGRDTAAGLDLPAAASAPRRICLRWPCSALILSRSVALRLLVTVYGKIT